MWKALAGTALAATGWMAAGAALAEPPAELRPAHVAGAGLNVMDLEGQKAWYMTKLGLSVTNTIKAPDGSPREYVMGYGEGPTAAIIALLKSPQRQPGPNAMGRLILLTPNAKALADWLKTQGVESRQVIANVAYFITDPEGNAVELYTPPKS